jgi:hypothetical protein
MTYLTTARQALKSDKREPLQEPTKDLSTKPATNIRAVEISFYDHEVYVDDKLIARISHDDDDFVTQRWMVIINEVEVYRANTWAKSYNYITWHYSQGTLPIQQPEVEPVTTGNEIMALIAAECEKFEFDLHDDGIYYNDTKLGEIGCTDGNWWVIRASCSSKTKISCDSAFDAVWSLWAVEVSPNIDADYEQLLDLPFEMLTSSQWQMIKGYKPVSERKELAAA